MTTTQPQGRWTYDDLAALPEDGLRHEIIDGVHYVTPSPVVRHQRIVGRLHLVLARWIDEHGGGEVFLSPLDVVFSPFDVVEPDLLWVSDAHTEILAGGTNVQGAPQLVIEVLSPSTRSRDLGVKRDLYSSRGVEEYWAVDPDANRVTVHRLAEGREQFVEAREELQTPLLPGLSIDLAAIFR